MHYFSAVYYLLSVAGHVKRAGLEPCPSGIPVMVHEVRMEHQWLMWALTRWEKTWDCLIVHSFQHITMPVQNSHFYCGHTQSHTCIHTHAYTHIHTYIHTPVYIHPHTYTHIHTHTHTHTYMWPNLRKPGIMAHTKIPSIMHYKT